MDIIATKRAIEFARKWAVDDQKGPLLLEFVTYRYGGHSYVFPCLYIFSWFNYVITKDVRSLDKEAKAEVDAAVVEAKESPEPRAEDLWTDIYYKGTEPSFMRGREREEVCIFPHSSWLKHLTCWVFQIHRY